MNDSPHEDGKGILIMDNALRRGRAFALRALTATVIAAGLSAVGFVGQPAGAKTLAPLVVGDICSCTGPEASSLGQSTPTALAWASWVNAQGGIDGHTVKVIAKDDGYSPTTALADAQGLVEQDHVVAIMDNSDEDAAWASYVKQQGVPVLGDTDTVAGYTNSDFFTPGLTFNNATNAGVASMKRAGVKKVADLYCSEVAICAQSASEVKAALPKVGGKLVYESSIGFAAPNYEAQCLAAKDAGATGMDVADASGIVTKVAQDCATQGYDPLEFSGDGSVSQAWLTVPAMQGNVDVQPDIPWFVHNAATKPMYAALDKYAPSVPASPNFGENAVQAWSEGVEFQLAAKAAHLSANPTAAQIIKGLYALPKGTTLDGISPPLGGFAKGKTSNNKCFFLMGINHGKFVTLNGLKPVCTS
jgi:branched-chain amino acid transport system substrate-binding protein